MSDLVAVATYNAEIEADEARLRLEQFGIECAITGQGLSQLYPAAAWTPLGGGIEVMVRESDSEAARKVLDQG